MAHAQILRVIDSLQLTAKHSVATPVNWDHGQDVVIVPAVSDEAAKDKVLLLPHVSLELLRGNSFAWCHFGGMSHAQMLTITGLMQFPKGWKTAELPSGKGYLRLTPEPPQSA